MAIEKCTYETAPAAAWAAAKKIRFLEEEGIRDAGAWGADDFPRLVLLRNADGVDCVYEDSPGDGPLFTVRFVYVPLAGRAPCVALFAEKNDNAGFIPVGFSGDLDTLILFD